MGLFKNTLSNIKVDAFTIKIVAITAMAIDHIGWLFIDTGSLLGQTVHFIGRMTLPLMCFLLVEGFNLSSNISRYSFRLFIFAILSQVPFTLMNNGISETLKNPSLLLSQGNVLFNLLLGLCVLIISRQSWHIFIRGLIILCLLLISTKLDWGEYIIIFCLVLSYYRDSRYRQSVVYIIAVLCMLVLTDLSVSQTMPLLTLQWMPLGMLAVAPFIYLYNGKKGLQLVGGKYFFYMFYPLHMLILAWVNWFIEF